MPLGTNIKTTRPFKSLFSHATSSDNILLYPYPLLTSSPSLVDIFFPTQDTRTLSQVYHRSMASMCSAAAVCLQQQRRRCTTSLLPGLLCGRENPQTWNFILACNIIQRGQVTNGYRALPSLGSMCGTLSRVPRRPLGIFVGPMGKHQRSPRKFWLAASSCWSRVPSFSESGTGFKNQTTVIVGMDQGVLCVRTVRLLHIFRQNVVLQDGPFCG